MQVIDSSDSGEVLISLASARPTSIYLYLRAYQEREWFFFSQRGEKRSFKGARREISTVDKVAAWVPPV